MTTDTKSTSSGVDLGAISSAAKKSRDADERATQARKVRDSLIARAVKNGSSQVSVAEHAGMSRQAVAQIVARLS